MKGTRYGRRPSLKDRIHEIMKDGRERTTSDICQQLNRMTESLRTSTGAALKEMHEMGLMERTSAAGFYLWRKPRKLTYSSTFSNQLPSSLPFSAASAKKRLETQQRVH